MGMMQLQGMRSKSQVARPVKREVERRCDHRRRKMSTRKNAGVGKQLHLEGMTMGLAHAVHSPVINRQIGLIGRQRSPVLRLVPASNSARPTVKSYCQGDSNNKVALRWLVEEALRWAFFGQPQINGADRWICGVAQVGNVATSSHMHSRE